MIEKSEIKTNEYGEIIEANVSIIKHVNAEQFCQLYLHDADEFFNLSVSEYKTLSMCMYLSEFYNDKDIPQIGNIIKTDQQFRHICKVKCGLADSTVRNALSLLEEKKLLIPHKDFKRVYYLNPQYFFKGKISDRTKAIKCTVEYLFDLDQIQK